MMLQELVRHRPWARHTALVLSGALTGLCLCLPALGFLEWVSLFPYLLICFAQAGDETVKLRGMYASGLWFNMSFSLVIFHWFVYMYPLEFAGLSPAAAVVVVLVAWWGLSLLQSLFGALLAPALALLMRARAGKRWPFLSVLAVAALWCIREWCQTLIWTGVPWGRLAVGQSDYALVLGAARYFGSYGITFAIVVLNAALAFAFLYPRFRRSCAVCGAATLSLTLVLGASTLLTDELHATDEWRTVAAVQGNIGSVDKWQTSSAESFQVYYDLSFSASEKGTDIIIWPETSVPRKLESTSLSMSTRLSHLAASRGSVVLAGYYIKGEDGKEYNAVRACDADGSLVEPFYGKRHPVPFGEYVPMRPIVEVLVPPLADISQLSGDIAPGADSAVMRTACADIGALICFDSIYEELAIDSVRDGAEVLAIVTNDSWFFDSAAVYMHNAQAKLRAVETGRYVIRTATTGISSIITPTGQSIAELPPLETGVLYGEIELRSDMTLYVLTGNLVVWLCIALCALWLADDTIFRMKTRKKG